MTGLISEYRLKVSLKFGICQASNQDTWKECKIQDWITGHQVTGLMILCQCSFAIMS